MFIKNIAIPAIAFLPHNFKIIPATWIFFRLVIPINFFMEIGRNFASIIITIINNITVLVSHICYLLWIFYAYEPWYQ